MTELVLDTPLTDDQRQCLETAKSAAESLLGLVDRFSTSKRSRPTGSNSIWPRSRCGTRWTTRPEAFLNAHDKRGST